MNNKVAFANNLRGIACIIVVISHFFGVFYAMPQAVHDLLRIGGTDLHEAVYPVFHFFQLPSIFNYGAIGVSLFFLISGFVIPFSLDKYTGKGFLFNRMCRIYPTYFCALSITVFVLFLNSSIYNSVFSITFSDFLRQAFLIRDLFWVPSLDGVSWTLEIEIKFYIICLFMYKIAKNKICGLLVVLLALSCMMLVMSYFSESIPYTQKFVVLLDVPILIYMLCGSIFNFMYREILSPRVSLIMMLLLLLIFKVTSNISILPENTYIISFIIFSGGYCLKNVIKENRLFSFMADISYPMYAVHGVLGYTILEYFVRANYNIWVGFMVTFSVVVLVSWVLHITVEKPTITLSKKYASCRRY